ncbi:MAG: phosphoribosylamine--glycine ligase [Oscillospiraceae bacterium]|nr:phosphoribosylamine--glycine ligase [Oscillospiraceae bacterium]MBQ4539423.1 phosphoribosylamine--glycine ligase [Oscillospiraceae bacterium]
MKILVVGSGGREHAIIKKLKESPKAEKIYAAPGNGGISADAECVAIGATDIEGIKDFAVKNAIDFVVVAPDDPLVLGMVDALEEVGIPSFGPKKAAAAIEGSKVFSKWLMKKYGIPTARYEAFEDVDKAVAYLKEQNSYPAVIKADGLALGKGVIIPENEEDAIAGLRSMMEDGQFGDSGRRVVIEQFLTGIELSVLAFTDGNIVVPMVSSMDHKRAYDNDEGLNTGGMGTIAPHPLFTPEMQQRCMDEIFMPTIEALKKEDREFRGCLYFGLMLCADGPKVIEYNCRFGDPETQVVLPLLDGDLLEIMQAVSAGKLSEVKVGIKPGSAACVIIASGGYPTSYKKGYAIHGLDEKGGAEGVTVYHAGTKLEDGVYKNNGGRVLGVTAVGTNLKEALDKAYAAVENIGFEGSFFRHDIGKKVL